MAVSSPCRQKSSFLDIRVCVCVSVCKCVCVCVCVCVLARACVLSVCLLLYLCPRVSVCEPADKFSRRKARRWSSTPARENPLAKPARTTPSTCTCASTSLPWLGPVFTSKGLMRRCVCLCMRACARACVQESLNVPSFPRPILTQTYAYTRAHTRTRTHGRGGAGR